MIIRSKIQSFSHQKKKLTINNSKSRFSLSKIPIQNLFQDKKKLSNFKNETQQNTQTLEASQKYSKVQFPILEKEKNHRKLSFTLSKKKFSKQQKNHQGLKLQKDQVKRSSNFNLFPLVQISQQKNEEKKLFLQNKSCYQNGRKKKLNISNQQKNKSLAENKEQSIKRKSNFMQNNYSDLTQFIQTIQNKPRQKIHETDDQFFSFDKNIFKQRFLSLNKTFQISIISKKKEVQKVDFEIQVGQEEKQVFQYLKYKRRKQQYENDFNALFEQLDVIKRQRNMYNQRVQCLLAHFNKGPCNEREQRIFSIKSQTSTLQSDVQKLINSKQNQYEQYVRYNQKLGQQLQANNLQTSNIAKKYLKIIKNCMKNAQIDTKFIRITTRLQNLIENKFRFASIKIQNHYLNGEPFKLDEVQLIQAFKNYKNSIQQYKGLLKNCFNHIKKVPQLCIGLYGEELPMMNLKNQLLNENNEFSMPKCMQCFNSQWKIHMIVQKNNLMKSILKVVEELFRQDKKQKCESI